MICWEYLLFKRVALPLQRVILGLTGAPTNAAACVITDVWVFGTSHVQ